MLKDSNGHMIVTFMYNGDKIGELQSLVESSYFCNIEQEPLFRGQARDVACPSLGTMMSW